MQTIESIRKSLTRLNLSEESQTSHTAHVLCRTGCEAAATSFPGSLSSALRWDPVNKLSTSADFSSLSADFTDHQIRLKGIKTPHML